MATPYHYCMDIKNSVERALQVTSAAIDLAQSGEAFGSLMDNPAYQRDAGSIIRKALDEGLDVLHLPNGDIVTTGTKIIVSTYRWDELSQQLVKQRASGERIRNSKRA